MTSSRTARPTVSIADPDVGEAEMDRLRSVVSSGQLSAGETVAAFEDEFAAYCGTDHGVATSNGTTALHTALAALGIGEGDTVVTTPLSFVATANAVRLVGAEPVFADVDPTTYNLDPHAVAETVRDLDGEVDAVLAVHLYGLPAAMDHLRDVADTHDLALIEDAAQAHGAAFDGRRVGSLGDVACFSFYPTKNMTTGEGGMVVTDRDDVAEAAAAFVDHGRSGHHTHERVGHNFRMTDLAAAIGRAQLEKLPGYVEARRENAARFDEALRGSDLVGPTEPANRTHAYHQYTIRCPGREGGDGDAAGPASESAGPAQAATEAANADPGPATRNRTAVHRSDVRDHLRDHGIDTAVYYPTPIHRQPAYDDVDCAAPNAERASREVLSVPVHPGLSDRDREAVATALESFGNDSQ